MDQGALTSFFGKVDSERYPPREQCHILLLEKEHHRLKSSLVGDMLIPRRVRGQYFFWLIGCPGGMVHLLIGCCFFVPSTMSQNESTNFPFLLVGKTEGKQ